MTKKDVFHIIQTTPYKDLIDFLLDRCNLSRKERDLVYERAKEGLTQEEYSEKVGYSPRNFQRIEDKTFDKIIKNWSEIDFLNKI